VPPAFVNLGASANPDINSTSNIAAYSGTSWTPPSQGLLILDVISSTSGGNGLVPDPNGNGLLFYQIKSILFGAANSHRITRFGANLTGSVTGILGLNWAAAQSSCRASVYYVSGTTVDFSFGVTGSFVQSPTGNATAGTTGTVTLAAAADSNNRPCVVFGHVGNEGSTPRANWDELDDLAGASPSGDNETQFRGDAFETTARATWATSSQWAGIASEIRAVSAGPQTYEDSVSISRKGTISDRNTLDIFPKSSLGLTAGISDGFQNAIGKQVIIDRLTGFNNSMGVGMFSVINLADILSVLNLARADMQASVSIPKDLGIDPAGSSIIYPNASLNKLLGIGTSGGLNLFYDIATARKLGVNLAANLSIFQSVALGRTIGFLPANIGMIGGSVSVAKALGLIDVPQLNAQASMSLQKILSILFSSTLAANDIFVILQTLSEKLGISSSAQLDARPIVGIGERAFLLSGNNADMNTANTLHETRAVELSGGLLIYGNVIIPINLSFLAQTLVSLFQNVSIQNRFGISDSVIANMNAGLIVAEKTGIVENVFQVLNTGLGLNVLYSIVTTADEQIIIVIKGFVFASDAAKNTTSALDTSPGVSVTDLIKTMLESNNS